MVGTETLNKVLVLAMVVGVVLWYYNANPITVSVNEPTLLRDCYVTGDCISVDFTISYNGLGRTEVAVSPPEFTTADGGKHLAYDKKKSITEYRNLIMNARFNETYSVNYGLFKDVAVKTSTMMPGEGL